MRKTDTIEDNAFADQSKPPEDKRPQNLIRTEQYLRWILLSLSVCACAYMLFTITSICTNALCLPYESQLTNSIQLIDKYIARVGSMGVLLLIFLLLTGLAERLTFSTFSEGALRKSRAPWFPLRYVKLFTEIVRDIQGNTKQ